MDLINQLTNTGFSFFRGDKNRNSYSLSPKVYNSNFRGFLNHLDEAIEEFSALTLGRNPIVSDGFLEDMINAQHYELPTRLLDWTESALIALYFSVNQDSEKNCDSIVWALNPTALNSKTSFLNKYGYVPIFPSKQDKGLVNELEKYYKYSTNDEIKYPIAIKTRKINPRIDAQRGVFVLFCHHDEKRCLTKYDDSHSFLHKIIIPHKNAKEILENLNSIGINQYSVFPELKSITLDLLKKYNKESR